MPTRFVDARQIVEELGLYGSKFAVHRATKRGEIPPPTKYGARFLWDRERLIEHAREREGQTVAPVQPPKKRKVIIRRAGG